MQTDTPILSHEREARADMIEAVALYLNEGHETMDEAALRRRGFTEREIADHGEAAAREGKALYQRRRKEGQGKVVSYLPFDRFGRRLGS